MTLRQWLATDYPDVLNLIDEVMAEFKASGSKERRNWADIFSGGKDGKELKVAGREFPVLEAAQISRGKPVTANALCLNVNEEPFPGVRKTGRWPKKHRLPAKAKRIASKQGRKPSVGHSRAS